MRWCLSTPGSAEYIFPVTLSTSVAPESPYNRDHSSQIYLEAAINCVRRCTKRLRLNELRDTLADQDKARFEMHLGTKGSSELRDAVGGHDRGSLEMHLEAEIKWTQRCTWKPWLSEFRDALGGCDRVSLEMHLAAVIECWDIYLEVMIDQDLRSTWRWLIWRWLIWMPSIRR